MSSEGAKRERKGGRVAPQWQFKYKLDLREAKKALATVALLGENHFLHCAEVSLWSHLTVGGFLHFPVKGFFCVSGWMLRGCCQLVFGA